MRLSCRHEGSSLHDEHVNIDVDVLLERSRCGAVNDILAFLALLAHVG